VRTWWLVIVAAHAIELLAVYPSMPQRLSTVLVCGLAYALFAPLLAWCLRHANAQTVRPQRRNLLLLRVFGDTPRTEALFDRIALRWQMFGPVAMIAAPDVVARMVDPGDFLRFALGQVDASFINSQADLQRRLATQDQAPDPDGRYRLNEFCCRDNTWKATVVALMESADAVVMDLRGFNPQRRGCEFELRELSLRLRPHKVILVVDGSTHHDLLAPYIASGTERMQTIHMPAQSVAANQACFEALLRAAA
jgi:hypothetical protein